MRLLPKSEINKLQAEAQKQAVDEGVKLAKRVDRLREVSADEEASLEQFRVKTLASIQAQLTPLQEQKDTLVSEVNKLIETRKELIVPLDAEWELVKQNRADLEQKALQLDIKSETLELLANSTKEAVATATARISYIDVLEETAKAKAIEADNFHGESKTTLLEAQKIKDEANLFLRQKTEELTHREQVCVNAENSIIMREKGLESERKSLLEERIRLEDRSRTLERAFNRLKK